MKVIDSDLVVMIDVDETLLMIPQSKGGISIELKNPYTGYIRVREIHTEHIDLIKQYKKQGYAVVVWSANGHLWAKEVVEKLNLTDMVDLVMCKPIKYVDDLKADEILTGRVYIPYK